MRAGIRAAAWALALAAAAAGSAGADTPPGTSPPAKPSSYRPHHTRSHVHGAPTSKPIVHKRKKPARPRQANGPAEPIK